MKFLRILVSSALSAVMVFVCSVTAFAEVDRDAIAKAWFKYRADEGNLNHGYEIDVGKEVPISDNPIAAVSYEWVKRNVAAIDDDSLSMVYIDDRNSLRELNNTFFDAYDYHLNDRGMCLLYDYGLSGYDNGVWTTESYGEYHNLDDEKYRRVVFVDNGDSFTLKTEDGTEVLGTYKKVYGFDTDEDIGYSGDLEDYQNGGDGGGNSGEFGDSSIGLSGDNSNASYNSSEFSSALSDNPTTPNTSLSSGASNEKQSNRDTNVVSGNNAPVTPEIVSAVDSAKNNMANQNETPNTKPITSEDIANNSQNSNTIIFVILGIVIAVLVGIILKNKKAK